jgi:hypothetical protein
MVLSLSTSSLYIYHGRMIVIWNNMATGTELGCSVSIVSDYGLDNQGSIPTEAEDFSSNLWVQTGSEAHPASYTMGTRGSFPRGKAWPGCDADHSPPSSANVKKEYKLYLLSSKAPPWHVAGPLYLFTFYILWQEVNK